jgi:hypothetical protein
MKTAHLVATALVALAAIATGPELACGLTHDDFESLCRLLNNQAQERAADAVMSYGLACNVDSDCAVVDESTSCSHTCPTIGTATAAADLPATLQSIEATTCAQYTSTVCVPAVVPPCVGTPRAVCVGGMCALATFDAGAPIVDAAPPEDASDAEASDAADASSDAAATDADADAGDAMALDDAAADAADGGDADAADAHVDAD